MVKGLWPTVFRLGLSVCSFLPNATLLAAPPSSACTALIKNLTQKPQSVLLPRLKHSGLTIERLGEAKPTMFPEALPPTEWGIAMRMAHHYKLTFSHRNRRQNFILIIPAMSQDITDLKTLLQLKLALDEMPASALRKIDYLVANPASSRIEKAYIQQTKYLPATPDSAHLNVCATVRQDSFRESHMDIYPSGLKLPLSQLLFVLRHELGHILALKRYRKLTPSRRWLQAIKNDKTAVSHYGLNSAAEDFAEAVRVYLATEGGLKAPEKRRKFAHRFAILDEILDVDLAILRDAEAKNSR